MQCCLALSHLRSLPISAYWEAQPRRGWTADLDMTTTDGIIYTYDNLVINVPATDAGVKFRQDDAWTVNWGGNAFPAGTASLNGPNIPAVNGTYNVTFNLNTLQYSFVAAGFNTITLIGDNVNIEFLTTDGVIYTVNNVSIPEGDYSFYLNGVIIPGATISVQDNFIILVIMLRQGNRHLTL